MSHEPPPGSDDAFRTRLAACGAAALRALVAVEAAARRLDPAALPALRERLAPLRGELGAARAALEATPAPEGLAGLRDELAAGAAAAEEALAGFAAAAPSAERVPRILAGMRAHARAQERLYPLRGVFPPLGRFFAEPAWHERLEALDPPPPPGAKLGLMRAGGDHGAHARGGFTLYVPERWDGRSPLALVTALHGGFGHGADFVWTWLREARSRGFALLAPTSRGSTWSLDGPERDGAALRSMLAWVGERWPLDRTRLLLTGLSDGGTMTLLAGLHPEAPWTALAPVAGVLHPANFALGNLGRARGRRILWVHGARDWMFPIALARMGRDALAEAGAEVTLHEVADCAHAYPREENDRILRFLDPSLGAPPPEAP